MRADRQVDEDGGVSFARGEGRGKEEGGGGLSLDPRHRTKTPITLAGRRERESARARAADDDEVRREKEETAAHDGAPLAAFASRVGSGCRSVVGGGGGKKRMLGRRRARRRVGWLDKEGKRLSRRNGVALVRLSVFPDATRSRHAREFPSLLPPLSISHSFFFLSTSSSLSLAPSPSLPRPLRPALFRYLFPSHTPRRSPSWPSVRAPAPPSSSLRPSSCCLSALTSRTTSRHVVRALPPSTRA